MVPVEPGWGAAGSCRHTVKLNFRQGAMPIRAYGTDHEDITEDQVRDGTIIQYSGMHGP